MANAADTPIKPDAPAPSRLRALLALLFQLIARADRAGDISRLLAQADQLLAAYLFETLIRITGRADLRATHTPAIHWRGATLRFALVPKPFALHPLHAVIAHTRRARAIARTRTAIGCRHRRTGKPSLLRFTNQRRAQRAVASRLRTCTAPASHTPPRISAPP